MKRIKGINRILAFIISIIIMVNCSQDVCAAHEIVYSNFDAKENINLEFGKIDEKLYDGMTAAELEKKIYESLSPEAKALYDSVDGNVVTRRQYSTLAASNNAYTVLIRELTAIGLPTAVFNSLKAAGASLAAAVADGPLPVGDILAALSAVAVVTTVALNWNEVAPKWNKIVAAFKKAFSKSSTNITSAFATTKNQVGEQTKKTPSITVSGKTVIINTVSYACGVKADSMTQTQKKSSKYFVALLYGQSVWVSPKAIPDGLAKVIMMGNDQRVGCFASEQKYAKGLCGGNSAIWHNVHNSSEGYFYHYHHPSYKKFHCWYI